MIKIEDHALLPFFRFPLLRILPRVIGFFSESGAGEAEEGPRRESAGGSRQGGMCHLVFGLLELGEEGPCGGGNVGEAGGTMERRVRAAGGM